MAIAAAVSGTTTPPQYSGKITFLLALSCLVAATGGLLYGYDTGVTGGVTSMESFLKKFFPEVYARMKEETSSASSNYCKFNSLMLTSFTASICVSGLIATLVAARVTAVHGRKVSIVVGGVAFLGGSALGGAAENIYVLLAGRLLLGVGLGFTNQSVLLYLSEMAPPKYRGAFNYSFQLFVSIGALSAFLMDYTTDAIASDLSWRIPLAAAVLPSLILIIGMIFLPDTPNSLIHRGCNLDKATTLLQRIRGTEDVDAEFADIVVASRVSAVSEQPFGKILKRKYRPQLVMSVAIPFFQQMTGIGVISFYAPILFRTIGYGESAALMSNVVIALVGISITLFSSWVVDKFGRRVAFQIGGILMFVMLVVIGGIMMAKLGDYGTLSKGYSNFLAVLIVTYVVGFGFSWGPLGWLVSSEIYPLEIRSAAQSMTVGVCFLTSFFVSQTFLAMLCWMKAGTFYFYGAWVALMTMFVWLLLPETKSVPIEKMGVVWKEHWFWKRYVCDGNKDKIDEPLLR